MSETVVNPFSYRSAAERYAKGRPNYHPRVMQRLSEFFGDALPFAQVLDIGCGTGMSTRALREIGSRVIGLDPSEAMLSVAEPMEGVEYLQSPAEQVPLSDHSVDLITAASAFHWLIQDDFLTEARRLLTPDGHMVFYGHGFTGQMAERDDFTTGYNEAYLKHYPTPPRHTHSYALDQPLPGFQLLLSEGYENTHRMTLERFIDYQITQSNVIQQVEAGTESIESVRDWMRERLLPFYDGDANAERTYCYHGHIRVYQRASD